MLNAVFTDLQERRHNLAQLRRLKLLHCQIVDNLTLLEREELASIRDIEAAVTDRLSVAVAEVGATQWQRDGRGMN